MQDYISLYKKYSIDFSEFQHSKEDILQELKIKNTFLWVFSFFTEIDTTRKQAKKLCQKAIDKDFFAQYAKNTQKFTKNISWIYSPKINEILNDYISFPNAKNILDFEVLNVLLLYLNHGKNWEFAIQHTQITPENIWKYSKDRAGNLQLYISTNFPIPDSLWQYEGESFGLGCKKEENTLLKLPEVVRNMKITGFSVGMCIDFENVLYISGLKRLSINFDSSFLTNIPAVALPEMKILEISMEAKNAELMLNMLPIMPNLKKLKINVSNKNKQKVDWQMILEKIAVLQHLKSLNLSFNRISVLPENIGKLTSLTHLELGYNQLKILPKSLTALTNLEILGICKNGLNTLENMEEVLLQLPKLKKVEAWHYSNGYSNQETWMEELRENGVEIRLN